MRNKGQVCTILFAACLAACDSGDASAPTTVAAAAAKAAPAAPGGVTATAGINKITIAWSASPEADSHSIYWTRDETHGYQRIGHASSPYVFESTHRVPHRFYITASSAGGESAPSSIVEATPEAGFPNDEFFPGQWHLRNTGQNGTPGEDVNVYPVWEMGLFGNGVRIAIVDDGMEIGHEDLAPNVIAAACHNYITGSTDPSTSGDISHGTSAAGVAAAKGNNMIGMASPAWNAELVGFNLLQDPTSVNEADAMARDVGTIYVSNNSWGPPDIAELGPSTALWTAAIETGLSTGRGGLGTIYCWAGGNGAQLDDNSNWDGYANFYGVMAVAAVDVDGRRSAYSEEGANIWVCAPSSRLGTSGIATTDVTGSGGYSGGDYTGSFGGTSSASPLAAGVAALVLEARPTLTWQDVRLILAQTARKVDPTDAGWEQNGAGYDIHYAYGFGVVDAEAAVLAAQSWTNVGPLKTSATVSSSPGLLIPDNDEVGVSDSIVVGGSGISKVFFVEVTFSANDHIFPGDLEITLTSPAGTQSRLANASLNALYFTFYDDWRFGSARHLGEGADGTWTLSVKDRFEFDVGTFQNWSLKIYGH